MGDCRLGEFGKLIGQTLGVFGPEAPLVSRTEHGVVISNIIEAEEHAEVVASWVSVDQIPEYLRRVGDGEAGRNEVMRDDYLPFVGRILVRLAHERGDEVWLPKVGCCYCPEVVIVTDDRAIQLLPGEKRRRKVEEPFDSDLASDLAAAALGY